MKRSNVKKGDIIKVTYCVVAPPVVKLETTIPEEAASTIIEKISASAVTTGTERQPPGWDPGASASTPAQTPVNGVGCHFNSADRDLAVLWGPQELRLKSYMAGGVSEQTEAFMSSPVVALSSTGFLVSAFAFPLQPRVFQLPFAVL